MANTDCNVIGWKFDGSFPSPFLWIKMVKACFHLLVNILFIQQWDIILRMIVLRIGHLFRITILIWSWGQGEPLDFILLIMFVVSRYFGFSLINELDGWIFKQFHPHWKFEWFVMICMFHDVFEMGFTSNFIRSGFYDFIFLEYVLTVAPKVFGEFSSWFITFLCFFLYFFLIKLETYRISSSLLLFDLSLGNAF